ncbi:MAG: SoxR reducing system RseC family protein [Melioribacteraceae bacterium]|nr:SoxR reducing system RseC family protein [Melioribacteraceae bacterium]
MINEEISERGIVVKNENGIAEVLIKPDKECGECTAKLFCKPAENNSRIFRIPYKHELLPGDEVSVSITGNLLVKISLLLYGIPLLIIVCVVSAGMNLIGTMTELLSILLSFGIITIYYGILYTRNKRNGSITSNLKITKIYSERSENKLTR